MTPAVYKLIGTVGLGRLMEVSRRVLQNEREQWMVRSDVKVWHILSLLLIMVGGLLALLIGERSAPAHFTALAFAIVLIGGLGVSQPRQPHAALYQPRGFATWLLKWVSAPQVEAAILWWFGVSLLVHPAGTTAFRGEFLLMGWLFLFLGWILVAHLPNPLEFTLIVSTRLGFIVLVALDSSRQGVSLILLGAYAGSILHGVVAMLLHWTLREVAEQVATLRQEVQRLHI